VRVFRLGELFRNTATKGSSYGGNNIKTPPRHGRHHGKRDSSVSPALPARHRKRDLCLYDSSALFAALIYEVKAEL
jgi:hypothetical protein